MARLMFEKAGSNDSVTGAEAKQELMQKLLSAADSGNLGAAPWLQLAWC